MNINKLIDHTALKPNTNKESILKLIAEAKTYDFASVCVNPCWVALAHQELKNTDIKVCTVIGFPLGANTTEVKVFETKDAIANGADEIDYVINITEWKEKNYDYIKEEMTQIVDVCRKHNVISKVIFDQFLPSKMIWKKMITRMMIAINPIPKKSQEMYLKMTFLE